MKKLWKVLLPLTVVVVVASVVVAVTTPGAAAGTMLPHGQFRVSGTFETVSSVEDPNPMVDPSTNTLVMVNVDYNLVRGSYNGFIRNESTITLNTQTGAFTFKGASIFTGTLNGVPGSLMSTMTGSGQFTSEASYTAHGESTFVKGTGGLAVIKSGTLSYDVQVVDGKEKPTAYSGSASAR